MKGTARISANIVQSRQAALLASLILPSSFVVHKYLGWEGLIAYAICATLGVAWSPSLPAGISRRSVLWLALATFFLVAVLFLVVYPIANTHVAFSGSDDDDAHNAGVTALLNGQFPYAQRTYLGNQLHQLPGGFVLAAPFVLLGTSALQNLFWLTMFFVTVAKEVRSERIALQLAWLVLALSPTVLHQIVTGTGYVSNAIYVVLALWWLTETSQKNVAAVFLGVVLASRANFLFILPVAFGWLRQHTYWHVAHRAMFFVSMVVVTLTVPFYLHDPANFGPLEAANRLFRFDSLFPHLGGMLLVMMAALSVALSFTMMDRSRLFQNCALVQAFPVVAGLVLTTFQEHRLDLSYAPYGSFFAWFGLTALVLQSPRLGRRSSYKQGW